MRGILNYRLCAPVTQRLTYSSGKSEFTGSIPIGTHQVMKRQFREQQELDFSSGEFLDPTTAGKRFPRWAFELNLARLSSIKNVLFENAIGLGVNFCSDNI